jgi:hypothetical protein
MMTGTQLDAGTVAVDRTIFTAGVNVGVGVDAPSIVFLIEDGDLTLSTRGSVQ